MIRCHPFSHKPQPWLSLSPRRIHALLCDGQPLQPSTIHHPLSKNQENGGSPWKSHYFRECQPAHAVVVPPSPDSINSNGAWCGNVPMCGGRGDGENGLWVPKIWHTKSLRLCLVYLGVKSTTSPSCKRVLIFLGQVEPLFWLKWDYPTRTRSYLVRFSTMVEDSQWGASSLEQLEKQVGNEHQKWSAWSTWD